MSLAEQPQKISVETQALIVLLCAATYFYAYELNIYLFNWLEFSHGVNWLYIPSGLRLLFVLILVHTGALGITLGTLAVQYIYGSPDAHIFNIVTAMVSGGAPYLSRYIAVHFFKLSPFLTGLTSKGFFKISVLFAVTNALLHNVWFFWYGQTENFIANAFAMFVGDWLGSVLVLAFASFTIQIYKLLSPMRP